jgi:hypothetical protein
MDIEEIKQVMTYKSIPAGQMRLYKALWDIENSGLSFRRLALNTHCTADETRATIGALGRRVSEALEYDLCAPSRVVMVRRGDGCYFLTEEMLAFIEATPSFKGALDRSHQEMFDLHGETAWQFVWDEDGEAGHLREFRR